MITAYRTGAEVPIALKRAGLSLSEANEWGRAYEMSRAVGADPGESIQRAWLAYRLGKRGELKESEAEAMEYLRYEGVTGRMQALGLKALELSEVQNPARPSASKVAGRMTAGNRAFHVERQTGGAAVFLFEGEALVALADSFALVPYTGTGQTLRTGQRATWRILSEADASAVLHDAVLAERNRFSHLLALNEAGRRNSAADEKRIADLVNLGLDLLGPEAAHKTLMARRAAIETPVQNESGDAVRAADDDGGSRKGSSRVVAGATRLFTPAMVERQAKRVLGGADSSDVYQPVTETRDDETVDRLFTLASELDLIAMGRVIFDMPATLGKLKEAEEILKRMEEDAKKVDPERYPHVPMNLDQNFTIRWLRERIELNQPYTTWIMLSQSDANTLGVFADNLRAIVRHRAYPTPLPESDAQAIAAELMDLCASEISEGRDPSREIRRRFRAMVEMCAGKAAHKSGAAHSEDDADEDDVAMKAKKARKRIAEAVAAVKTKKKKAAPTELFASG